MSSEADPSETARREASEKPAPSPDDAREKVDELEEEHVDTPERGAKTVDPAPDQQGDAEPPD
ncbi:hypothetical protein GTV32_18660 [Gordonia sp. SID5947]|uniref:hypothetical protein n=1 Tax=Gordonia sp. SID5947 TaxID=2690315 RepID=UPI001371E481|nr:hypothetical protein [Gordonia sp. SID5947]MYR08191.1 hypothetical protein [Gordonia sp. SID5947]